MGRRPTVTLRTVAEHVGVSRMTVSNAFSRPDQLSADLRERVLAAAAELGYAGPDPVARGLARGTVGAVGLLTGSLRHAFSDEISTRFLGAIAEELAPTGLALTLLPTSDRDDVAPARDVALDGAIVYSCPPGSPAVGHLTRRGMPLVLVDQPPSDGVTCVNVDDRDGARAAAQHLLDLGHRRVGVLAAGIGTEVGLTDEPLADLAARAVAHAARQRLLGWADALDAAGVRPTVARQPDAYAAADAGAGALLDLPGPPTAVLCFSDAVADGVLRAARTRGLRVPEDLSVVGFDDNPLAARCEPPLTTVRQDVDAKGRAAVAALLDALAARRAGVVVPARRTALAATLVVRASTAPPAPAAPPARRPAPPRASTYPAPHPHHPRRKDTP